jgi:hypothetical protein
MEIPGVVPEPTRSRLVFQSEAADIQFVISKLMQSVQAFLSELLTRRGWTSPADDDVAAGFVDEYWRQKKRWTGLQPTDRLRPVWAQIDEDLEKLGVVMEKLPVLGAGEEEDLPKRVHAVQDEFRAELDGLAIDEDRLYDLERELRETEG